MGGTGTSRKILAFTTVVEAATGLAAIADPGLVVRLLLGNDLTGAGPAVARCFGIAILSLGLACWPGRRGDGADPRAARAMLVYNAAIALYLAWVGAGWGLAGPLLWPAVALHAVVAVLLAGGRRGVSPAR